MVAAAYVTGAWIEVGSAPAVTPRDGRRGGRLRAAALGRGRRHRPSRARRTGGRGNDDRDGARRRERLGGCWTPAIDVAVLRAYELALIATAAGLAADLRFGDWSAAAVAGLVDRVGMRRGPDA